MINERAIKIGRTEAFKSVAIGLLIAQLMMMQLSWNRGPVGALLWFTHVDYQINLLIAIAAIYLCAYVFGGMAGTCIIIKKWNYLVTGFIFGLLILVSATFLASWTAFFQEGLDELHREGTPFYDYIFKPLFWVTVTGFLPALIVGFWFGYRIYKNGKKIQSVASPRGGSSEAT